MTVFKNIPTISDVNSWRQKKGRHWIWGEGVVQNTSGKGAGMLITVGFNNGVKKTLMAEYAKLEKIVQLGDR